MENLLINSSDIHQKIIQKAKITLKKINKQKQQIVHSQLKIYEEIEVDIQLLDECDIEIMNVLSNNFRRDYDSNNIYKYYDTIDTDYDNINERCRTPELIENYAFL